MKKIKKLEKRLQNIEKQIGLRKEFANGIAVTFSEPVKMDGANFKEVEKKEFTKSELKDIVFGIFGGDKQTVYSKINQYLEYNKDK
jgi:uncharacterized protein YqfB (UPF0267 family)